MKKCTIPLLLLLFLAGCKAWDGSRVTVKKDPLSPKLLSLQGKFDDISNLVVVAGSDRVRLFSHEVEDNLTDPYGNKYGYIVMRQHIIKMKAGYGWAIFDGLTLGVPILFGCPLGYFKYKIEVEIRIIDSQGRLIGKYAATGKGTAGMAMYWGYSAQNVLRKVYTDAINDAFNQIRPQIRNDVTMLNDKLQSAGKLTFSPQTR
jgi:hypothetical protein